MKICKICNKEFNDIHFNEKRSWKIKFCSTQCARVYSSSLRKPVVKKGEIKICQFCKKEYYVSQNRKLKTKFCSRSCLAKVHLPQFKKFGFQPTGKPPHTYKSISVNGKSIRLHRHIMQGHIGRKLTREEHVHHINGDSLDNRIENLIVLSNAEHQRTEHVVRKRDLSL